MKTVVAALCLVAVPASALAQTAPAAFYAEAGAGVTFLQDVKTKTYTGAIDGNTFSIKADASYNPAIAVDAEIGYAGFAGGLFRAGVSYDYLNITLRRARITGNINNVPVDESLTRGQLSALGLSFDNNLTVFGGNLYYNLPPITENIRPYIGAGGGLAIVQKANTVPAGAITAGLRVGFGSNGYFGLRYRLDYVAGPKDRLGIQYAPVVAHTFSAMIGAYFD